MSGRCDPGRSISFDFAAFYEAVTRARKERDVRQWELAIYVGVELSTIAKLRYRPPSAAVLVALCKWADLDAREFLIDSEVLA